MFENNQVEKTAETELYQLKNDIQSIENIQNDIQIMNSKLEKISQRKLQDELASFEDEMKQVQKKLSGLDELIVFHSKRKSERALYERFLNDNVKLRSLKSHLKKIESMITEKENTLQSMEKGSLSSDLAKLRMKQSDLMGEVRFTIIF